MLVIRERDEEKRIISVALVCEDADDLEIAEALRVGRVKVGNHYSTGSRKTALFMVPNRKPGRKRG